MVEIKIKNYGADGFEVSDNGSGIAESNFEGITAKHHTSKLKEFSDLESIKTFGFRGEALSSLCALSNVTITTRHSSCEHGHKLVFDHDGAIIKKSICASKVGTTVSVTDFFITLPVRRGEFVKNYRKDFTKMVQLIQEYCLVLTGIRIHFTNQPPKGARQTVLTTTGSSVLDNIISIFGHKQAKDLVRIKSPTEDGTDEGQYTQQSLADLDNSSSVAELKQPELDNLNLSRFKIEGFISNIDLHCARSAKDRQYFYINSRPVELRIISKEVNEVYRRYNQKQFPFVYLNLKMDQSTVDVNLSKDKRQVAVCNDKILLLAVKRSLLNTFGAMPSKLRSVGINSCLKKYEGEDGSEDEEDQILVAEPSNTFSQTLRQWKKTPHDPTPKIDSKSIKRKPTGQPKGQKAAKVPLLFHQKITEIENRSFRSSDTENSPPLEKEPEVSFRIDCKPRKSVNTLTFEKVDSSTLQESTRDNQKSDEDEEMTIENDLAEENREKTLETVDEKLSRSIASLEKTFLEIQETPPDSDELMNEEPVAAEDESDDCTLIGATPSTSFQVIQVDTPKVDAFKHSYKVKVSLAAIAQMAQAEEEASDRLQAEKKSRKLKLRFKESIDPSKSKKAEVELETEIKKEMFKDMEVLGQFNLGFIIAKLNSDVFIVDQHASDEKYNFESLEKTTKLQMQPLVIPERLELSAIQEMTLIENLSVFEMNGFRFLIDESAPPGSKVRIHSKPFSKNWEFGREDIEEMIFMLDDSPNCVCRPSRIRTMLASRACRQSVMIGKPLTKKHMKKMLEHLGELDHPWVS